MVESKKTPFHQITSNFPNRNPFWQKLNVEPTFQKMTGYINRGARNMLLWRHNGRLVKILYIEHYLSYTHDAKLIIKVH